MRGASIFLHIRIKFQVFPLLGNTKQFPKFYDYRRQTNYAKLIVSIEKGSRVTTRLAKP